MIDRRFAELRQEGRKALVVYVTAGHPDIGSSVALMQGIAAAGADVLEIGVPFSDPVADGPVIQASSQIAIDRGVDFNATIKMIEQARLSIPVVLFSYLNPVIAAGPDALQRASDAGAHGILITDLPLGADPEREEWLATGPLDYVRLAAPTTPADRMQEIARHGSGFVYLISRLGVTGEQAGISADLPATIERLRSVTSLPICVGFGVSGRKQAVEIAAFADGVVVGSAVVRAAARDIDEAIALVADIRQGMDLGK